MASEPMRQRIAVLIDHVDLLTAGYETQLRSGFETASRRLNLDLLLVCGRSFDDKQGADAARCLINHQITQRAVDGVIVTAAVTGGPALPRFYEWLETRRSLPVCCVGLSLPNMPGVVIDNVAGMRAITEHLLRVHHRRRLAFLQGTANNSEAELRYEVFRETLLKHGLELDERLVACGNFVRRGGELAMQAIIDRTIPFDAVVAANDGMALGAIDALRERGFQVPYQIAVTGFDDMAQAQLANPPLTTVHQPVETVGETAVEVLFELINGRQAATLVQIPTECVVRESCGCGRQWPSVDLSGGPAMAESAVAFIRRVGAQIRTKVIGLMTTDSGTCEQAGELVDALEDDLAGQEGRFLFTLDRVLNAIRQNNELHSSLQLVIGHLRSELSGFQLAELNELWDRARMRIALANTYSQSQQRYFVEESYEQWVTIGETLAAALDLGSLKHRLCTSLQAVGIPNFIVSLYAPTTQSLLVPYAVVVNGSEVEVATSPYSADLLFPPGLHPVERRTTWNCFPLAFEEQPLGIICLENSGARGYQLLCDQISAAVRNVRLHDEIVEKTLLHERSVQERIATAKRLLSLSVLAGGVAHDLNNALGPLVALPDIMRADIVQSQFGSPETTPRLLEDVDAIRTGSMRAAQTIKDLLTLGRQGRTAKEPTDIKRILQECIASDPLRTVGVSTTEIHIVAELSREPLFVLGSESHLTRAFVNLLRNAAEALGGHGTILVKSALRTVPKPVARYEVIEVGTYVYVSISDTGSGIADSDLACVFEPFFSKKRLSDRSGSGLGLAIVHGVVKEHDGFVDVESTVGVGTTFSLYFPHCTTAPQSKVLSSAPPHERARILVVDDEPIQLRTARRVLVHLGYEVETVTSGHQALELFGLGSATSEPARAQLESPYDLVILDMILDDGCDGLEVYEKVRASFPNQRVIIASGHAPTDRTDLAIHQGVPWLAKPYTVEMLAKSVRAALGSAAS